MAKSIYEILNDLTTTTNVPSQTPSEINHVLPSELFPTDLEFENADMLLEWAEDHGVTHACLQRGVQKFLIDVRATFKACKKDDTWTPEYGQANVNAMEWKVTKRPNQGSQEVNEAVLEAGSKIALAMADEGVTSDIIRASLKSTYKDVEVDAIMAELDN